MATYFQWRFPKSSKKEPRNFIAPRVAWLCGSERVLVEQAVDDIRSALRFVGPLVCATFTLPSDDVSDVWGSAFQQMLDSSNRLTLVRGADRISSWDPLTAWLEQSRFMPNSFLAFVSSKSDFPRAPSFMSAPKPGKKYGRMTKGVLDSHIAGIQKKGALVRCSYPRPDLNWVKFKSGYRSDEIQILEWLDSLAPGITPETGVHLIRQSGHDLRKMRDFCKMLSLLGATPSIALVDSMVRPSAAESFIDSLTVGDKRKAMRALEFLRVDEYGQVLSGLFTRTMKMGRLNELYREGRRTPDQLISERGSLNVLFVNFENSIGLYTPSRLDRLLPAMVETESAWRSGISAGVLETLVSVW